MCSYSENDIDGSIRAILNKELFKKFCDNMIFGYFWKKKHCVVQAQLCRCVISLEIKGSSFSAIVIRANGTSLNFTPREFAIVIGLNYVEFKNIEPTQKELAKFQIPEKNVLEDERSVDSDDDFQDPPSKQINEQFADKEAEQPDVEDFGLDRSGQHFSPNVVQTLDNMFDGTKTNKVNVGMSSKSELHGHIDLGTEKQIMTPPDEQRDEPVWPDSQNTILDVLLPSNSFAIMDTILAHLDASAREIAKANAVLDKLGLDMSTILERLDQQIDACFYYLRKKSKYDPNKSYKYSTVDCNFMNTIRCIFLYDSYKSSGHYPVVLAEIKKLAESIPFCLQACDFYDKKGIDLQNHPRYIDKDSLDLFDVLFEDNLPQQPSGSLDCGLYVVTYTEHVSYGHKVLSIEFDPKALRTRYVALLWDYGIRKQEANAHSDFEAPLRPVRQSRLTSVTEVFDV
ncbi:hypothetical protein FXO38_15320 [Capsicum annuum]|nr:hypothetical protein FXO38_15320 [Capsicum annuum]